MIIEFLNKVLLEAVNKKASDIHFETYDNSYRIRFRIDGILHEMYQQPITLATYLTARLKILAHLDVSERRLPQDGQFKINFANDRQVDFRLSTCPTLYGEKAVLRILEPNAEKLDIQKLGMSSQQATLFTLALTQPQGLIIVTGPTGSGKTMTLYSALNFLNSPEVNILSVEDPIEISLNGINQVQVNPKIELSFSSVLRAFLRQDPDIIMLGEIRDLESAENAIKAAQTGHLVLSTLHTNSAIETLIRLHNMGIAPHNLASSITLIIAQRLIRKLCLYCRQVLPFPDNLLMDKSFLAEQLTNVKTYQALGCEHCYQGYKDRIGIFELLPISSDNKPLILEGDHFFRLRQQVSMRNDMSLKAAGLEKIIQGVTSFDEVKRVVAI